LMFALNLDWREQNISIFKKILFYDL